MTFRLAYTRLLVDDYSACFRFYRDVLGLSPTFGDEESNYADFNTGDVTLALFSRAEMMEALGSEGRPGATSDGVDLIFRVDDVDASVKELEEGGVRMIAPATDHPEWGIRTAHFRDPAGTLLEIFTPLAS